MSEGIHRDRKHPTHQPVFEQFNRSNIIHVTVCSKNRRHIFANAQSHEVIVAAWLKADRWKVGRYAIMPDHIHFFCSPVGIEYPPLIKWIRYWKSMASNHWPRPDEHPIWQTDFWDTQLRRSDSYSEKWHYIRNNPVRAGLCETATDWPYQGELETLFWHE
ncbi:REP-associated tyrosine transposase [Pontiella sp.]|uniref:REP-associated tyrosine transposase n=1 Tax=Pontiella sp. TaxID=2837462 RepID=UPI0035630882